MSDDDPRDDGFEDVARALADEARRAFERIAEIDMDEIMRTASAEAERARGWIDDLARRLREQAGAAGGAWFAAEERWSDTPAPAGDPAEARARAAEDPLRHAGPNPLDLPTADQGLALAALDSGRWGLEPGTSALVVHGEGPAPRDALGLVRELRVRDWISTRGELTLAGHSALRRWLEASERA